jgi:hypothetical protein
MDFDKRLERAIGRGKQKKEMQGRQAEEEALSEEELKSQHSAFRLELSEHAEGCLRQLGEHFPGFRYETVVGEKGWGAKISRDDFASRSTAGQSNLYSRFEILVTPFSQVHIIEVSAKATIRNTEAFNRRNYQFLAQIDLESFKETIDLWILEYAEKYASEG